jgi:hypothetical protein
MRELRVCRNVDGAMAVPADIVLSCPKKKVEALVGVSRDDFFAALGKPASCRHPDGSIEGWNDQRCRDEFNVDYAFYPPCKWGPGTPAILGILFSSAGIVSRARWETSAIYDGMVTCVP